MLEIEVSVEVWLIKRPLTMLESNMYDPWCPGCSLLMSQEKLWKVFQVPDYLLSMWELQRSSKLLSSAWSKFLAVAVIWRMNQLILTCKKKCVCICFQQPY